MKQATMASGCLSEGQDENMDLNSPQINPLNTSHISDMSKASTIKIKTVPIEKDYEQIKFLGEGAFGKVYLMKHRTSEQLRAVKVQDLSLNKEEEAKLHQEIQSLKNLDHANIVKIFDVYKNNKTYSIVQEYF